MRPVVCMITRRPGNGEGAEEAVIRRVAVASRAGVHLVQIRERDMPDGALVRLATRAVDATRSTRTRVLVNDRLDVALASRAHGVHLRADSAPAPRVRAVVPPGFLIGRSVHSVEEAVRVSAEGGLDYLLFGTVFETDSKPGQAPAGVSGLADVVAAVTRLPVLAVGGIAARTVPLLRGSGCAGFAAIGLFADGPEASLAPILAAVMAPWDNRQ